jgi:hypothetical protein
MAKRQAIRLQGEGAEDAFLKLVPGSRKSPNAKSGDVVVPLDGSEHFVEVKECHAEARKGGTINQVRAIKYITCVVWAPNQGCWYVVAPDQLVRFAANKTRGQHTEIPFESMNFNLASIGPTLHTKANNQELATAVHTAIRRGLASPKLGELMISLLDEIVALKRRYIDAVHKIDSKD